MPVAARSAAEEGSPAFSNEEQATAPRQSRQQLLPGLVHGTAEQNEYKEQKEYKEYKEHKEYMDLVPRSSGLLPSIRCPVVFLRGSPAHSSGSMQSLSFA